MLVEFESYQIQKSAVLGAKSGLVEVLIAVDILVSKPAIELRGSLDIKIEGECRSQSRVN